MSNLGLGVMINMLKDNGEIIDAIRNVTGKKIKNLELKDDKLIFTLPEGIFKLWDDGQSCCERRYITTDDKLEDFIGGIVLDFKISGIEEKNKDCEPHEIQFIIIKTSKGEFTIATHNEHNGYYGGFSPTATFQKNEVGKARGGAK